MSLEQAKELNRKFLRRLKRLSDKATLGDEQASHTLIQTMTERDVELKKLGFMIDEKSGKVVPFDPAVNERYHEQLDKWLMENLGKSRTDFH